METVGGEGNLLLTCRRGAAGVEITRVETGDRAVTLPETLWGLPVTALGDHAFSPGPRTAAGEQVRVGGPMGERGEENAAIGEITLPSTLETVGDYCFYNCTGLKTLRLADKTLRWGGSALMNCRLLDTFHITLSDHRAEVLSYFAGELSRELDATLVYPDGETARLIFPEYIESYEENTPAKHFDYHIYGAGYPYHHCFWRKAFQMREYDGLWPHFLGAEYSQDCALRLAYYRLRHPRELTDQAAAGYWAYLRGRLGDVLSWLLTERDVRGLAWLLGQAKPEAAVLERACHQARQQGLAEAMALLLAAGRRENPARPQKSFEL